MEIYSHIRLDIFNHKHPILQFFRFLSVPRVNSQCQEGDHDMLHRNHSGPAEPALTSPGSKDTLWVSAEVQGAWLTSTEHSAG